MLPDQLHAQAGISVERDELAQIATEIEQAVAEERYNDALTILQEDFTGVWFAISPSRTVEILQILSTHATNATPIVAAARQAFVTDQTGTADSPDVLASVDFSNPMELYALTMLRLSDYRLKGRTHEGLEQSFQLEHHLGLMQPLLDSSDGWILHTAVQIGVSAMLAGNFTQALTHFTRAQMHVPVPKFAFLTRDALAKAALIHACFGNTTTARSLLQRSDRIPRTSSWVEAHLDAHRNIVDVLVSYESYDDALEQLEAINLHDVGEMWPFYILAVYRILEGGGYHDELEHRMEMFDNMPFPRVDGNGFAGSIVPLKRAMIAMKTGRGTEAQEFLDRADSSFLYTQLIDAAASIYAGRTQHAIQQASRLRTETRGFRLLEIRRLSILAAAQYQADELDDCLETLKRAADLPRGLSQPEIQFFSPETRELAAKKVKGWPRDKAGPSAFLTKLPKPGLALTDREVEILGLLAKGLTRAQMAEQMFISVNTLKTHLKSIYKKLDVSTANEALLGAQRRGLI